MGRAFISPLVSTSTGGRGDIFACRCCAVPLAYKKDLKSKDFHARTGRAYLVANVANVILGTTVDRHMISGLHQVADIMCIRCLTTLGWKYLNAYDDRLAYKIGKYILEVHLITVVPSSKYTAQPNAIPREALYPSEAWSAFTQPSDEDPEEEAQLESAELTSPFLGVSPLAMARTSGGSLLSWLTGEATGSADAANRLVRLTNIALATSDAARATGSDGISTDVDHDESEDRNS